jgi:hypothetical protein
MITLEIRVLNCRRTHHSRKERLQYPRQIRARFDWRSIFLLIRGIRYHMYSSHNLNTERELCCLGQRLACEVLYVLSGAIRTLKP